MSTADELDYNKIRDAMDLAIEKLRKKEAEDALKPKKEEETTKDKLDVEKKNKIFKWVAYSAAILIGIIIIGLIIYLIMGASSPKTPSPNVINQPVPIMKNNPNYNPYDLFHQPPPMQPPIQAPMQPPMPLPIQAPIQAPMQPPMQPPIQAPIQAPMPNYNNDSSSFNFPSNDSSFFNKLDTSSSIIKKGGLKKNNYLIDNYFINNYCALNKKR